MSLPRLLVVLLILFSLSFTFAENKPKQQPKKSISTPTPKTWDTMSNDERNAAYAVVLGFLHNQRDGAFNSGSTCYTMRTYVAHTNFDKKIVVNAEPEAVSYAPSTPSADKPDSTLMEPYTTCTPSLRFDVRTTVQPVETVNDGK